MKEVDATNSYNIESFKLNYRAFIPFYVLLDPDLSKKELALYGLIEQMESSKGDVFYTNKSLATILAVSVRAIQQMNEHLQEKNYIKRELRVVIIKKRKTEMHCWSIVRNGLVLDCTVDEVQLHPMDSNYTGGEVQLHGGGEAVLHGGGEVQLHPCKALDLKSLDINVCGEKQPTHTQFASLTTDPECLQLFSEKFSKLDVTIEDVATACTAHYEPATVSVMRFKSWIKREQTENYSPKRQTKKMNHSSFNEKDQEIVGQYKQALRNGLVEQWFPDLNKRAYAKKLFEEQTK